MVNKINVNKHVERVHKKLSKIKSVKKQLTKNVNFTKNVLGLVIRHRQDHLTIP